MTENYLSQIQYKRINKKLYFNLNDIKKYLIDDLDIILVKLNYYDVNDKLYEKEYIDIYLLILLIAFSNDFRTYQYKFYLVSSTTEKISEIFNPDLCLDRLRSLKYKRGYNDSYKFNKAVESNTTYSVKEMIYEEINNSHNIDSFRQII